MAPTFRLRRMVASVAGATALSLVASVTPAYAQSELSLTQLVNAVSSADNDLRALELEMGQLRETGNRALADLRDAQSRSEQARIGLEAAQELLASSQSALEKAQARLDELSRAAYRQGATAPAGVAGNAEDSLDRRTYLRQQVEEQQQVVDDLERERTENANQESLQRQAAELAKQREEEAAAAEAAARETIEDNQGQIAALEQEREQLVETRDDASRQLADARGTAPGNDALDDVVPEQEVVPVADTAEIETTADEVPGAAAAEQVAETQPEHASFEDPYGGEAATDLLPQQAPETDAATADATGAEEAGTELEALLPELDTPADEPVQDGAEDLVEVAIARAQSQIGVPYAWGGGNAQGPTAGLRDGGIGDHHGDYDNVGFDCSGLVLYAFAGAGIDLPHYTGYQYLRGTPVSHDDMQRGDLIFYGPNGGQHVAIYLGDGMMLEAPASGGHVQETPVRWSGLSPHAVRLV